MIKKIHCLFLLLFVPLITWAQNKTIITGKVLTGEGEPAAGITVSVPNTAYADITDDAGVYRLQVKAGSYSLRIYALGRIAKEISVKVESGATFHAETLILPFSANQLKDVVVTGQYAPQSLKNSMYMVRTISSRQIEMRSASKVQELLMNELGFRFSDDLTLGTADVTMLGISGQRVKILLDGIPLLDRGETRESLNQIDINTIDRIELVEGPMSVSYGSDALAGVINLITKKMTGQSMQLSMRVQEQTAGKKYTGFQGTGNHLANIGLHWKDSFWQFGTNFTRNFFDGAQLGWLPKEQYMGSATVGYHKGDLQVRYRLDAENETLKNNGRPNPNTFIRTDAHYITRSWMHQLQAEWTLNNRIDFDGAVSYTDYSRRTQTTTLNTQTGDRRLTLGAGEQDEALFDTKFFRGTMRYRISQSWSFQPGMELNMTGSSGARILGTPAINDYAFFVSSEWQPIKAVSIRPGARFIKNSVYDAPPVIPSLNTKIIFSKAFDLRMAYARGFRSPALRELYFNFFDASHSIRGNRNLKAEFSNSFNASVAWQPVFKGALGLKSSLSGFYNDFDNLITTGYDAADASAMTYININKTETAGGSLDNTLTFKNLEAKLGFSYTGVYSLLQDAPKDQLHYTWYPEISSTLLYHFEKLKGDINFFYKYNGRLPTYEVAEVNGESTIHLAERAAFSLADLTLNKSVLKQLNLSFGVKNLFNVTNVNNTSLNTGAAHSTGGPVPLAYGRSYFIGLNFQFIKH